MIVKPLPNAMPASVTVSRRSRQQGFTLLEAVVGMTVLAIALTLLSTLLFPLAERSADAFLRAKSAQVSQAVLAELSGRRFDRATPDGGGQVSPITCCSDDGGLCPGSGGDPRQWQLLDNFDGYSGNAEALLGSGHYQNFQVAIGVSCETGLGWSGGAKLLTVAVTSPSGEVMQFSQLRGNY
ncbi:type II secretion system protein [uncultured Ferrimonas sp.]|uniref:type IV pilus modification PilV family protein n=1 Tax=uncultured Ferrimonas sp. TaxID=432640 RepID=UPI00261621FD|nr:type II secretion system protein [uncultured Ferrimonas sp.]